MRHSVALLGFTLSLWTLGSQAALVLSTQGVDGLVPVGAPDATVEVQVVIDSGNTEVTSTVDILLLAAPPGFMLLEATPGALLAPDVGPDLAAACNDPLGCWSILNTGSLINALRVPLDEAPPALLGPGVLATWTFAIAPDVLPGSYAFSYQVWFDNVNACGSFDAECAGQIQVAPEPGALALLLGGLAVLGLTARRVRRRPS
jgi:hypothetical protein